MISPHRFTGKERDTESGLDYFGARYYASHLGRFTSIDPSRESASPENPQSWNRYPYTLNNPLKYVDPDGAHPVIAIVNLIQRAAATPTGQRVIAFAQSQGARLFNAATQFFNSPTGQDITQGAIETVGGVPLGMSISPRSAFAREVNAALRSTEAGIRLEGRLGKQLLDRLVSFKSQVFEGGKRVGEIDLELGNAIIEATVTRGGKTGQVLKLLTDKALNPSGKTVIVFGPNLSPGAIRDIRRVGGKVA